MWLRRTDVEGRIAGDHTPASNLHILIQINAASPAASTVRMLL
jgi:hypothetical protein